MFTVCVQERVLQAQLDGGPSFPPPQDTDEPLSHIHFTAEGEVTFKSILFVPASAPRGMFDEYGSKKNDYIKVRPRSVEQ